jgi:heterodisulfide reductase subunit D
MTSYKNVLQYRDQIYRCNTCGRCARGPWDPNQPETIKTPAKQCPIYETHRSLNSSSQGMMLIIRALLEDKLQPTDNLVEAMYECLLCEGCNAVCAGRDVLPLGQLECADIFRALRADFVDLGIAPPPQLKKVTNLIAEKHNRQGTQRKRDAWADGMNIPATGSTIIFTSCTAAYQDTGALQSLAKVMQLAGMDFGLLEDEWCCGALQLDSGLLDSFKISAQHNVDAIRRAGAKEIVVTCADCYKTLKNDYPNFVGELGFDVIHSSELILRLLNEGKIQFNKDIDLGGLATYFDPCFLARGANVIEEPRSVLHAIPGTEWVEMEGFGKYTYCCGRPITASGSLETYVQTGQDRIKDALAVDARTIITGCVNCTQSLTTAAKKLGADIKVMDITELVAQAVSK